MLLECVINDRIFPSNSIEGVVIKESIHSQIIEGELNIFDFAFIDPKEIYESEEYKVTFLVYDILEDVQKTLTFLIYAIEDGTTQGNNKITLKFCSWYAPDLYSKTFTKSYNSTKYTDIIKKLLKTNRVESDIIVESDKGVNLMLPNQSIIKSIRYMLKHSVDASKRGGYLAFPDLFTQKMNIVNYNSMNKGIIQKYEKVLLNDAENMEYISNITKLDIIQEFDILKLLEKGINTTLTTFNFDNGKVEKVDNDIIQLLKNEDASYSKILMNEKFNNTDYGNNEGVLFSNKDEMKAILSNKHYDILNNSFKLSVGVNGDYGRKLGCILPLVIYKYDSDGVTTDNKISGAYILQEIEHKISTKGYTQSIIISKSGMEI